MIVRGGSHDETGTSSGCEGVSHSRVRLRKQAHLSTRYVIIEVGTTHEHVSSQALVEHLYRTTTCGAPGLALFATVVIHALYRHHFVGDLREASVAKYAIVGNNRY